MEILGNKDTRSGFGEGLAELGDENENVVALCADLTGSLKMNAFQNAHPNRFFQVGIAEANMMSLAAGTYLSSSSLQFSKTKRFLTPIVKQVFIRIN